MADYHGRDCFFIAHMVNMAMLVLVVSRISAALLLDLLCSYLHCVDYWNRKGYLKPYIQRPEKNVFLLGNDNCDKFQHHFPQYHSSLKPSLYIWVFFSILLKRQLYIHASIYLIWAIFATWGIEENWVAKIMR